jgi:predicted amidophosphoribosyltransferase
VTNENVPRTVRLAGALAAHLETATVSDILRWKEVMIPSSRGGTRNPQILYENLVLTTRPPTTQVILIDDVRTTGAHLIATAAKLAEAGTPSSLAICAARTVLNQNEAPFSLLEENLPDFLPSKR